MILPPPYIPSMYCSSPPPECPECHRPEDIKEVCRNCGYEYSEGEGMALWKILLMLIFIVILVLWFLITLSDFVFTNYEHYTLSQIIGSQWQWLSSLRIW